MHFYSLLTCFSCSGSIWEVLEISTFGRGPQEATQLWTEASRVLLTCALLLVIGSAREQVTVSVTVLPSLLLWEPLPVNRSCGVTSSSEFVRTCVGPGCSLHRAFQCHCGRVLAWATGLTTSEKPRKFSLYHTMGWHIIHSVRGVQRWFIRTKRWPTCGGGCGGERRGGTSAIYGLFICISTWFPAPCPPLEMYNTNSEVHLTIQFTICLSTYGTMHDADQYNSILTTRSYHNKSVSQFRNGIHEM